MRRRVDSIDIKDAESTDPAPLTYLQIRSVLLQKQVIWCGRSTALYPVSSGTVCCHTLDLESFSECEFPADPLLQ